MIYKVLQHYAKVLLSVSQKYGEQDMVYQEMQAFHTAIDVQYRDFIKTKLVHWSQAQEVLEKDLIPLFSSSLQKIIRIICKNKRLIILPNLPQVYCDLYENKYKITKACITSVVPLLKKQEQCFVSMIQKMYPDHKIKIQNTVDSNILGGFQIKIKNLLIKVDLRSQLNLFKKNLVA